MDPRHLKSSSKIFRWFLPWALALSCTPGAEISDEVDYNVTSDGVDCYETSVEPERRQVQVGLESCEEIICTWACARHQGLDRRDVELFFRKCPADDAHRLVDRSVVESLQCDSNPGGGGGGYATCPAQPCCLCCEAGSRPCGSECIPEDQPCDETAGCACWAG